MKWDPLIKKATPITPKLSPKLLFILRVVHQIAIGQIFTIFLIHLFLFKSKILIKTFKLFLKEKYVMDIKLNVDDVFRQDESTLFHFINLFKEKSQITKIELYKSLIRIK